MTGMTAEEMKNTLDRIHAQFSAQRLAEKKRQADNPNTSEQQAEWGHMADKMQSSFGPGMIPEPDTDFQNCEYYCQVCHPAMENMTVEMHYDPKNGVNIYRCLECGSHRTEEPGFDYFQHGDLIVMDN